MKDRAGDRGHGMRGGAARLGMIGMLALMAFAATPVQAADDAWSEDVSWVSMRVGSARSGARLAGDGAFGYGFGYTWFLANQWSWSATAQHDILGRYGNASEIEVPVTVEFARHFHFSTQARPYLGVGWGGIFHKTYRTGADASGFRQGIYVATGGNGALNDKSLIGVDVRVMLEQDTRSINPTFPNAEASSTTWSVKLSYSRVL